MEITQKHFQGVVSLKLSRCVMMREILHNIFSVKGSTAEEKRKKSGIIFIFDPSSLKYGRSSVCSDNTYLFFANNAYCHSYCY